MVALITGHGLKTREVLDGRAGATVTVRPNIDALSEALEPSPAWPSPADCLWSTGRLTLELDFSVASGE